MQSAFQFKTTQEDFLARITEAVYSVVLRQGLQRSFVDVELELWQQVRNVFRREVVPDGPAPDGGCFADRRFLGRRCVSLIHRVPRG